MGYNPGLWWMVVFPILCVFIIPIYWAAIVAVSLTFKRRKGAAYLAMSCLMVAAAATAVNYVLLIDTFRPIEISALVWVPFVIAALSSGIWVKHEPNQETKGGERNG